MLYVLFIGSGNAAGLFPKETHMTYRTPRRRKHRTPVRTILLNIAVSVVCTLAAVSFGAFILVAGAEAARTMGAH
jgi:hypothetical protein